MFYRQWLLRCGLWARLSAIHLIYRFNYRGFILLLFGWMVCFPLYAQQPLQDVFRSSPTTNVLTSSLQKTNFVSPSEAFGFHAEQDGNLVHLHWQLQPGYYLYRQKIHIQGEKLQYQPYLLPEGKVHHDAYFGTVDILTEAFTVDVQLTQSQPNSELVVTYQGCAVKGFCYPPQVEHIPIAGRTTSQHKLALNQAGSVSSASIKSTPIKDHDGTRLPFTPLWAFLLGIGIAFTPCVLPMYPLLSTVIIGGQRERRPMRVFGLAMLYVQGMAVAYTILGVIVAAIGAPLQIWLQSPPVLIVLSILFVLIALAMFDVFNLQLPSSWQTKLTGISSQQKQGTPLGVFVMGMLAGLICSPCTTAPLSAILLYIIESGHLLTGGVTLYLYAFGMGIPLILFALFGYSLLPRGGQWMVYVKQGMGFVLLALPVFLLNRLLPDVWGTLLWSLFGFCFLGWGLLLSLRATFRGKIVLQLVLLLALLIVVFPVQQYVWSSSAFSTPARSLQIAHENEPSLHFQRVTSSQQLQSLLLQAKQQQRPVVLDFYADWCVACKELDAMVFHDQTVQHALSAMMLLRVDATHNDTNISALMREYQVIGLPAILFFDHKGQRLPMQRINGFIPVEQFMSHLTPLMAE